MIPITLSKKGNGMWLTQHYGVYGQNIRPMIIPHCARCTGIFIFWKTIFDDGVVYSITGAHLPPSRGKFIKRIMDDFLKQIIKDIYPLAKPYYASICGGKIDTPQNEFFYRNSFQHYVLPLHKKYPDLQINIYSPIKETADMTMILDEDGNVFTNMRTFTT